MEPSAELCDLVRRIYRVSADEFVEQIDELYAQSADLVVIGIERHEWWHGFATVREAHRSVRETLGAVVWEEGALHAWVEGTVGWAVDNPTVRIADGASLEQRMTWVFHREQERWRVVHIHLSSGIVTDEGGTHQATTIQDLVRGVIDDRPDLSATATVDGTVTVLFSDIEASTELAETMGDIAWLEKLRAHEALIRDATARHHGTVVKQMGDLWRTPARRAEGHRRRANRVPRVVTRAGGVVMADRPETQYTKSGDFYLVSRHGSAYGPV